MSPPTLTVPQSATSIPSRFPEDGSRLVFVIGPFRGGTTLLRKVLDGHSGVHSPAETWFLLPLLEMWQGRGTGEGFQPAQAAAALKHHLDQPQFVDCCRAFAARFYEHALPKPGLLFVDKTPLYLTIADALPAIFPKARFLVLARDPRALLWSRASWQHAHDHDPARHVEGVAADIQRLAVFLERHGDRSHLVSYEGLCRDAERTVSDITEFLGLPFEPAMIEYGAHTHHEGYGDEKSRAHRAPHLASIDRWLTEGAIPEAVQGSLLERCGSAPLDRLGLGDLAPSAVTGSAPIARSPGRPDGPSLVALMHEGTNSRDHFDDFVRGFEQAGCAVQRVELNSITGPPGNDDAPGTARRLTDVLQRHGAQATLAMWASGFAGLPNAVIDGERRPFFDAMELPHLAFWLDAPHWAHQGKCAELFGTSLLRSTSCRHLINNQGTAAEMAGVLGFTNVVARPYGIDTEVFRPIEGVEPRFDLVFCLGPGCPPPTDSMLAALDSDDPDQEAIRAELAATVPATWPALLNVLPAEDREGVHHLLELLLQIQLRGRGTPMLSRLEAIIAHQPALAPAARALIARPGLWVSSTATLRRIETWERAFVFTYLARRFKCAVFSQPSLDAWDCPAERLGWVGHRDQSAVYAQGRAALNIMRWQDDVGLNPKVMEIAASGVPCLCATRTDLDDLYRADEEIIVFDTAADAARSLRALLDDDTGRRAVAEAGLERTRSDHTWARRASELLPVLVGG